MRRLHVVLAAIAGLGAAVGVPFAAAPALAATAVLPGTSLLQGFYSVPYSSTLLWVHSIPGGVEVKEATFADWRSQGFPAPVPAATRYVRAPSFSTIFAQHQIPGMTSFWMSPHVLSYEEWARAGFPAPLVSSTEAPYVSFERYLGAPTIYARQLMERHALTYADWSAAGFPAPRTAGWAPDEQIVRYSTGSELFSKSPTGTHKLSFAEWVAIGQPSPVGSGESFYKLSWDDGIASVTPVASRVLDFDDWAALDFPTPKVVNLIPGDEYCYDPDIDAVYYSGATVEGYLTVDEADEFLGVDVDSTDECWVE